MKREFLVSASLSAAIGLIAASSFVSDLISDLVPGWFLTSDQLVNHYGLWIPIAMILGVLLAAASFHSTRHLHREDSPNAGKQ